jgi:signal transduction histidine kinase
MMTGLDDVESIERAYDVGATDFISKPISWMILVQRIRYMLRASAAFRRLQLNEKRLAEAQRIAAMGNFSWRPGRTQVECSAEALRIFGVAEASGGVSMHRILRRLPAADRATLRDALRQPASPGEPISIDSYVAASPSAIRNISLRAEAVVDGDGHLCIQGTVQDISERKRIETELKSARDQAQTADAAKTAFLANMSHELRTPLNIIIGFSELMAQEAFGPLPNARYRDYATDILKTGRLMFELISDILLMTKVEADSYELALEPIDLRGLIQDTLALFRGSPAARDRELVLVGGRDCPWIEADRRAAKQMLLNLLSNAVKFSETDTPVHVHCSREPNGRVRLSVIDRGIGMTPEQAQLAVRPFRQVDTRLARKYDGAGLGLSIVKRFIELHGGELVIDSEPNVGSCISLVFPAALVIAGGSAAGASRGKVEGPAGG